MGKLAQTTDNFSSKNESQVRNGLESCRNVIQAKQYRYWIDVQDIIAVVKFAMEQLAKFTSI